MYEDQLTKNISLKVIRASKWELINFKINCSLKERKTLRVNDEIYYIHERLIVNELDGVDTSDR